MRETLRSGRIGWGVAVLVTAIWSGQARADVVGPGPAECPDGATPNACHGAEYCDPVLCAGDAACMGGKVCRDVSLCVRGMTCFGGGGGGGDDTAVKDAFKACSEGMTCSEGACETLKVCVDPEEPTSGGPTSGGTAGSSGPATGSDETDGTDKKTGCDCRSDADAAPGLLLATLLGLIVRRRRR